MHKLQPLMADIIAAVHAELLPGMFSIYDNETYGPTLKIGQTDDGQL